MGAIVHLDSTNPLAEASLGLGIVTIPIFWWAGTLGAAPAVGAIVTGLLAFSQIARSRTHQNGRVLALLGMVLAVALAVSFFVTLLVMRAFAVEFIRSAIGSIPTAS